LIFICFFLFFFQAEDGIRDFHVTGVQTCALPILWDVATGQDVLLLRGQPPRSGDGGHNPVLAWSPDGQRLAAMNWNGSVSVWDRSEERRVGKECRYRWALYQ